MLVPAEPNEISQSNAGHPNAPTNVRYRG